MAWDFRMGAVRIRDSQEPWSTRLGCLLRGHDTEAMDEAIIKVDEPEDDPEPEPKAGVIYIEQPYTLHWISEVHIEIVRCKRCQALWRRERSCKSGPPKQLSRWAAMRVDGRVIAPPV